MKKLIVGNWKMNPIKGAEAKKIFTAIARTAMKFKNVETVICPPLIYVESLGSLVTNRSCVIGSQDAFWEHAGAYTGQVSPDMIFAAKARYVIVGHSERRAMGETDSIIAKKLKSILTFPLIPIICVGELERDEDGEYLKKIKHQLKSSLQGLTQEEVARIVVAYEPVWAIGAKAKKACSPAMCREVIQNIRHVLADLLGSTDAARSITILYGGSVDDLNAKSFIEEGLAEGLLVGRASLDPKVFTTILKQVEKL